MVTLSSLYCSIERLTFSEVKVVGVRTEPKRPPSVSAALFEDTKSVSAQ